MNRTQALRLAITALEFRRARFRVDANIAEKLGADTPAFKAALKTVDDCTQAINILRQELEAQTHYPAQVIQ